MISTSTLNFKRADFAEAGIIAEKNEPTPVWNWLRSLDSAKQNPVYVKSNSGWARATKVEEGDPNPTQTRLALPQLTLIQKRRGFKYIHTIESQEFDPYNKFEEAGRFAGAAIAMAKEQDATDLVLNNAFDATNYPIATGKAFYDDDHLLGDYTHDNLGSTAALSETSVEAAITALGSQKNPRNEPMPYVKGMYLLVPPALELTARKIIQSTQTLGSNNNDANVVRDRLTAMVCPRATSTTAWALVPQNMQDHYVYKAVAVANDTGIDQDEDGFVKAAYWSLYEVGAENGLNCYGNPGA